ncbi:hypothetical protein [Streptomyces sp. NPDC058294]|uniref:hypothetical protein n=1 Tax=Streptomyces sp. NPDC058294 TaxID=3346430 RepID=UPI0036E0D67C
MSYDLAVWEGARPTDDKTARRVFDGFAGPLSSPGPGVRQGLVPYSGDGLVKTETLGVRADCLYAPDDEDHAGDWGKEHGEPAGRVCCHRVGHVPVTDPARDLDQGGGIGGGVRQSRSHDEPHDSEGQAERRCAQHERTVPRPGAAPRDELQQQDVL